MADLDTDNPATSSGHRIEGGIDAVVIGAGADGLAAAALLGKAGLHTVLAGVGPELGGRIAAREIAPSVAGVDGEHLVTVLDPDVIAELDLYRHGLAFAARRLETTYYFEDGDSLSFDGDPLEAGQAALDDEDDREALDAFMREMLETAAFLRPAFAPAAFPDARKGALEKALAQASPAMSAQLRRALLSTADDVLRARFGEGPLRTLFLAEAVFRSAAPPGEPFSLAPLIRRLSGEAAGLQGAAAYPKGGAVSVIAALRRAVQAAKVDMRPATPVQSILIEGDRVAGVALKDGGQLRAPIVVADLDARQVFLDMIGPAGIDVGLQRALAGIRPEIASARMQIVLKGVPEDDKTQRNLSRRLIYAPPPEAVVAAFVEARCGRAPDQLIVEALFPTALDEGARLDKRQIMSLIAHPVPYSPAPDAALRDAVRAGILRSIEKFAPGLTARIEAWDLQLASDEETAARARPGSYAAKPAVLQQWALSAAVAHAGGIGGLYVCGPETQIGAGLSCASGRAAAKAALQAYRRSAA